MCGIHTISHIYRSSKPQDLENSLTFHVLGIDIFIDSQLKCWLLEVNQAPSFCTDSPLDHQVKKNLLRDTLHILNLTWKRKNRYFREQKNERADRLTGKQRLTAPERDQLRQKKLRIKEKFENNNLGDYQNLFPLKRGLSEEDDKLMDRYEKILLKSKEVHDDSTT